MSESTPVTETINVPDEVFYRLRCADQDCKLIDRDLADAGKAMYELKAKLDAAKAHYEELMTAFVTSLTDGGKWSVPETFTLSETERSITRTLVTVGAPAATEAVAE